MMLFLVSVEVERVEIVAVITMPTMIRRMIGRVIRALNDKFFIKSSLGGCVSQSSLQLKRNIHQDVLFVAKEGENCNCIISFD
jgi:hypothetical protein